MISLNTEKKDIIAKIQGLEEKNRQLFYEYCAMEGKYGKKVRDDNADPHSRPYFFQYTTGKKEKEDAEREQFLIDSGYNKNKETIAKLKSRKTEIEEAICLKKYGMSRKKRQLDVAIKSLEAEIAEMQERLAEYKKRFEED